jgi:hypothetical protein
MATLPCVFRKTHGKVTKTNSINSAFAVRLWPWRTTKSLICHAFLALAHGKEPSLPCVFSRCTAKGVTRRLIPAPSVVFFCRAPWKNTQQRLFAVRCQMRRTAKGLYRAKCYRAPFAVRPDEKRTAKSLPCARGARQSRCFP